MRPAVLRPRRSGDSQLDQAIRVTHRDVRRVAESSESAESLLLNLTVGIVVVDPRYYILRINSAARQMLGIHGTAYDQDFVHLAEVLPSSAIRGAIDSALTGKTTSTVFEWSPLMLPARLPISWRPSSVHTASRSVPSKAPSSN